VKENAMESLVTFLDCPAYLDNDGAARCGLPAEVQVRYTMNSTDGLLESAKIRCPLGHWFNGPIESLVIPVRPLSPCGADAESRFRVHQERRPSQQ
jgi:hypothetical protein